jgi:hypothetical protein
MVIENYYVIAAELGIKTAPSILFIYKNRT